MTSNSPSGHAQLFRSARLQFDRLVRQDFGLVEGGMQRPRVRCGSESQVFLDC